MSENAFVFEHPLPFENPALFDPAEPRADPWLYIAEMEHRVANEYALAVASISLAAAGSPDLTVKAALLGAAQRLRDYASAHRTLQAPLTSEPVDLSAYLTEVLGALTRASLSERRIRIALIEEPVEIDAHRCWRVGLIVSELITNAVRHGFKGGGGAIIIQLARHVGEVVCRVSDNGRPALAPRAGHGTRVIQALAEELGGVVDWRFHADGTTASLTFPEADDGPGRRPPPPRRQRPGPRGRG